jgi:hypothetical protein
MRPLKANCLIAGTGLILGNRGFVLSNDEANTLLSSHEQNKHLIFPLRTGRDLAGQVRNVFVIDPNGWSESELLQNFPAIYQHLRERVYPERQTNRDERLRNYWWLFRRSNDQVRQAILGLSRYIATPETAKHCVFTFLDTSIKPEHGLVVIGSDDAFILGILSCLIHVSWSLILGGTLEDRPRYQKDRCFDPFPFPDPTPEQKQNIRELGDRLDSHRKQVQSAHPDIKLFGI